MDPGPYTPGSTIAVPVFVSDAAGSLLTTNSFRLYLSNNTGSFATETLIGEYKSFYAAFVNGTIPATAAPGTYKVRVKSSAPAVISSESAPFVVSAGDKVTAEISASSAQTIASNPTTFGSCNSANAGNTTYIFTNATSPATAVVTASVKNELTGTPASPLVFSTPSQTFSATRAHFTIVVRAEVNGFVGTKAYFLINSVVNTAFSTTGTSAVCLPADPLEY